MEKKTHHTVRNLHRCRPNKLEQIHRTTYTTQCDITPQKWPKEQQNQ